MKKASKRTDLQQWKSSEFSNFKRVIAGLTQVILDEQREKIRKIFDKIAKARMEIKSTEEGRWKLKFSHCFLLKRCYSLETLLTLRKQCKGAHRITKVIDAS